MISGDIIREKFFSSTFQSYQKLLMNIHYTSQYFSNCMLIIRLYLDTLFDVFILIQG